MNFMYYAPGRNSVQSNWLAVAITPSNIKPSYDLWHAMNYGYHTAVDTRQVVKPGKWRW
eukprot:UN23028